jgi:hypothetical protein
MTNHPITPPPELVDQWHVEAMKSFRTNGVYRQDIATQAAQWGADTELRECCEWMEKTSWVDSEVAEELCMVRRPKPASLKEQAMAQLQTVEEVLNYYTSGCIVDTIRRALESLDD